MSTPATLVTSTTTLSAGTAAKCPATAQTSRQWIKAYNDTGNVVYYGASSSVTASTGIPIQEGDWAQEWTIADLYFISAGGGVIRTLEAA